MGLKSAAVCRLHATPEHAGTNTSSMSPPSLRPASNNPFLDELEGYDERAGSPAPGARTHEVGATEEKERLRQRYAAEDDLPPAYEEVAGSRVREAYPQEKKERPRHEQRPRREERPRESGKARPRTKERAKERTRERKERPREREERTKERKKDEKTGALPKNVDTIDKLDVTGLFGGAFHHDGPFDACTPHRNLNKKVAPVLAFPKDGPNSTLSGATAHKSAMNEVFGIDEDDDSYLYSRRDVGERSSSTVNAIKNHSEVTQFDAKVTADLVHGPVTQGLGSTTFLDGAPAAPVAIEAMKQSTVGRKKSLSHRLAKSPPSASAIGPDPRNGNLKLTKTHSGYLEDEKEDDEDAYTGARDTDNKKESSGNKFLRRVKSLKVTRR